MTRKLPSPLSSLYSKDFEKLTVNELEAVCQKKFEEGLTVMTGDEADLEESTKLQAQSLLWFEQKVGQITSSKFFAAIRASLNPPPASLVKEIMERRNNCKSVPAIQWGISMRSQQKKLILTKHVMSTKTCHSCQQVCMSNCILVPPLMVSFIVIVVGNGC